MNYERKYKEALGWMQSLYDGLHGATKEDAEHYFPELLESKDERNIKDLIDELKCSLRAANCQNEACNGGHEKRIALLEWAIAWLEKQGEKVTHINGEDYGIDGLYHAINILEKTLGRVGGYQSDDGILEHKAAINAVKELYKKQGENKPTDNVEIKFCEGDKVVSNQDGKVYTVGTTYYVIGDDICLHDTDGNHLWTNRDDLDENYHLWTIEDAKDGDVLNSPSHRLIWIYKDNEHYHVCVNMNYATKNIATDGLIKIPDACPATKDERTILFEKIKEAGYEWDADNKELNKIEPKILDADKVIAWLEDNTSDFEYYVNLFKEDFGL